MHDRPPSQSAAKLRWALIVPWATHSPGGVNVVVRQLARSLRATQEIAPEIVIARPIQDAELERCSDGFTPVSKALFPGWDPASGSVKTLLGMLLRMPGAAWRLWHANLDVVNLHYPTGNLAFFACQRWLALGGFMLVSSLHGTEIRRFSTVSRLRKTIATWLLNKSDAVVVVSEAFRSECLSILPGLRNIHVIYNGVTPQATLNTACASSNGLAQHRFLAVATFEEKKGLDVVIRAFAQIVPQLPDWRLRICGRRTSYATQIEALIAQLALGEKVELNYDLPHEAMPAVYRSASVFVHGARIESFGLVILEAAVHALPVIATRVGGIPEIIRQPAEGTLVPPDDVEAMSQAMLTLARNPTTRIEAGRNASQRLLSRFSWDRCATEYINVARRVH